jgi:hypothetical protein
MTRLAVASAHNPGTTIAAWIAAVIVSAALSALFLGDALSGEAEQLNNPESEQAYDLIEERLPPDPEFTSDLVLLRTASATSAQARQKFSEVAAELSQAPGVQHVS